ncbi:MAG: nucleoside hydrolase [Nocardioides sp.]|uniref:nucleoside hydrolase n=1 Tax=Nocardioides sp. TaxID=35761 RepID=UPI0039E3A7FD
MTVPLFLDCDTGIDDALALAYLLRTPGVDLVGIGTVSGNVSAARAAQNTLALLELEGVGDLPVFVGRHDPLVGGFLGGAPMVHGVDGVGDIGLPEPSTRVAALDAAAALSRLAREHPGELRVLAIGPLTNLGVALASDPELPGLIHSVTLMGGAVLAEGNITPYAPRPTSSTTPRPPRPCSPRRGR